MPPLHVGRVGDDQAHGHREDEDQPSVSPPVSLDAVNDTD
jgi:hypothetical protein